VRLIRGDQSVRIVQTHIQVIGIDAFVS
jgi:hypothetical protein